MEQMSPIYFIGCPRTGSKIYMKVLNNFTDINISEEIHYLHPKFLHKDFVRVVKDEIGSLKNEKDVDELIDLIRDRNRLFGTFWKKHNLDLDAFKLAILKSDLSFESIFKIILVEDANSKNKDRCGAKFPMHFSFLNVLFEWTSNCKVVHIIRDPRAIYASQLKKHLKKTSNPVKKKLLRIKILFYIIVIYKWDTFIQKKYSNYQNYHISKYEDLVNDFDTKMKQICNFIDVKYDVRMENIPVRDSSYIKKNKSSGIVSSSLYKYKEVISKTESILIESLCKSEMKMRGYM